MRQVIRLIISFVFILFCIIMFIRAKFIGDTNGLIFWGVFYLTGLLSEYNHREENS